MICFMAGSEPAAPSPVHVFFSRAPGPRTLLATGIFLLVGAGFGVSMPRS